MIYNISRKFNGDPPLNAIRKILRRYDRYSASVIAYTTSLSLTNCCNVMDEDDDDEDDDEEEDDDRNDGNDDAKNDDTSLPLASNVNNDDAYGNC
jgi:hypothetical protein